MLHFASLRRVRPGLIVFAADVFGYLPYLGTGGVNAAGREAHIRAGAASRLPTCPASHLIHALPAKPSMDTLGSRRCLRVPCEAPFSPSQVTGV